MSQLNLKIPGELNTGAARELNSMGSTDALQDDCKTCIKPDIVGVGCSMALRVSPSLRLGKSISTGHGGTGAKGGKLH